MSAEILRRAAEKMRERADAAIHDSSGEFRWAVAESMSDVVVTTGRMRYGIAEGLAEADAEHIASWHPAVALAVADTFDALADLLSDFIAQRNGTSPTITLPVHRAIAAARAYLGESA